MKKLKSIKNFENGNRSFSADVMAKVAGGVIEGTTRPESYSTNWDGPDTEYWIYDDCNNVIRGWVEYASGTTTEF